MQQLSLLDSEEKQSYQIEEKTTVKLGKRRAEVSLRKRRREATKKLKEILAQLEGKDILVSFCGGAQVHFWVDDLLLRRLKVKWVLLSQEWPNVLILRGTRSKGRQQHIRIFLEHLINVREQYYGDGRPYYLIDFWNGWGEYPIDQYRPKGYVSLDIRAAR